MNWGGLQYLFSPSILGLSVTGVGLIGIGCAVCLLIAVRVLQRRKPSPESIAATTSPDSSTGLEQYFTDVEEVREHFATLLTLPSLSKRLFVIHGVGGIGKSSLLRMFRLHSRKIGVPIALALGDEVNFPTDVLYSWARDLEGQVSLPNFASELAQYRELVDKVKTHATKEPGGTKHPNVGKAVIKGVVQGSATALGLIPGVGIPLSILLGGASDTLVDWLHGFLSKSQIDLLLDPTEQLTERFLSDLTDASARGRGSSGSGRIVLLLDTYEKLLTLDQWLAKLAQRLPPDVLLVVSGRTIPSGWAKEWPDWMTYATIKELEPMTEDIMRQLVRRYYVAQCGVEPPPEQVEAIIRFARGLPIAVTTVVQMWIQYDMKDFQAIKPRVVADLVDRLTNDIPERMRSALKAAAALRWFNLELLRAVSGADTVTDDVYAELRRFPFVRPHWRGHALHDSVREYLDESLRLEEPARHKALHARAADFFHDQGEQASGDSATEATFEELYHRVMADEEDGMRRLCASAEEFVRYQLVSQLRALVTDLANYPLQQADSQLWRDYYRARLFDLEGHRAEAMELYQIVADDERAPDRLRAYALVDWAWITRQHPDVMSGVLQRFRVLFPEPDALVEPDSKLGVALFELAELHWGQWDEMLGFLERARSFYEKINDRYWLPYSYNRLKYYYLDRGMWRQAERMQQQGLTELDKLASERERTYLRAEFLGGVAVGWIWAGQYHETEKMLREALALAERFHRVQQNMYFRRDLGLALGLQGRFEEAQHQFAKGREIGPQLDPLYEIGTRDFEAVVTLKCKGPDAAESLFASCLDERGQLVDTRTDRGMPYLLNWYGALHEQRGALNLAEERYRQCRDLREQQQWHWHAGALAGLVRIYQKREKISAVDAALSEVEAVLRQHPFAQHLASVRLSQAHLAWDRRLPGGEQGFDSALRLYQQALMYAMSYNRFLLDEVLSGEPNATPLQSIIPHCLARDAEGQLMLVALANWWGADSPPPLAPEPERIAPMPVDAPLIVLEKQVRSQEPGAGQPAQLTVIAQIHQALERARG